MKAILLFTFIILLFSELKSQEYHPTIHQEELEKYNALGNASAENYEAIQTDAVDFEKLNCNLDRVVYGWHPYWVGTAYQNYQWDLLSHMSFFSYEVNASDGEAINTHGWSTSAAVDAALASGNTKVTLCVTLFSGHTTFFGSPTAQQTLISTLINLVQTRGAHGVNIDFEGLPSSQTINFANFMVDLSNQMHGAIPNSEVSTVLYAVDWNNVFDFSIMEPFVDHYIIMGYAYYYSGSSTAGPTDPLYHFGSTYNYTLSRSITYYLDKGCPKSKLVLGLPSYGYEWPTVDLQIPSATTGTGSARTYAYVKNNSSGFYSLANHTWEVDSYTDDYGFNNGGPRQCLISLEDSWEKRLEHVRRTGIAGIGIWALGYDNGYTELWDLMGDYLTDCYEDSCSGSFHDFGGPTRNYYNDEDYTWTIQPIGATSIDVNFSMFDIELNWDYLYVYDGDSDLSPQIVGSPFTGSNSPGSFTSSTGAITFRFTSDVSTVAPGFLATYTCNSQALPVAGFSYGQLDICQGDSILLTSTSTDADTFSWSTSMGGLSNASDENPYLFPSVSGIYDIQLDVSNATGSDQINQVLNINVFDSPIAQATPNSTNFTLPNATVFFTNSSMNSTTYYWDFGDSGTSNDQDPWHAYAANGIYNVILIASNEGCPSDTTYFTIYVGVEGVDELSDDLLFFPNPFENKIFLLTTLEIESIRLLDINGRLIKVDYLKSNEGYEVHITDVESGVYFLRLETQDAFETLRLIKN